MSFPRGRSLFASALVIVLALSSLVAAPAARAGKNDLDLLNLCTPQLAGGNQECGWVQRDSTGAITSQVAPSPAALANFRSLMSELGVVIAPRLITPADTLGYAGFQVSAELGLTQISHNAAYWNGVQGVDPANPGANRPDAYLTTVGGFVRKGMLIPFPAFEVGAGAVNIVGSGLFALQGYAKLALQEGFHSWVLPSVAVRAAASQLVGTDQVDLTVFGFDVVISKAFSIAGTARFEPFGGYNLLFIDARSGVIDATPNCDAYAFQHGSAAPGSCGGPAGTPNDYLADFTFPRQDLITRQRIFAGFKLKLGVVFMAAEYDLVPAGRSRDETQAQGTIDGSQRQQSFSFSTGLDF